MQSHTCMARQSHPDFYPATRFHRINCTVLEDPAQRIIHKFIGLYPFWPDKNCWKAPAVSFPTGLISSKTDTTRESYEPKQLRAKSHLECIHFNTQGSKPPAWLCRGCLPDSSLTGSSGKAKIIPGNFPDQGDQGVKKKVDIMFY